MYHEVNIKKLYMVLALDWIFCTYLKTDSDFALYKDVSKSSRTVLVKRSLLTLDVKILHHLQSTPLLHEYSGPSVSAMLGSIPGSTFLELCQVPAAIPLESLQWCRIFDTFRHKFHFPFYPISHRTWCTPFVRQLPPYRRYQKIAGGWCNTHIKTRATIKRFHIQPRHSAHSLTWHHRNTLAGNSWTTSDLRVMCIVLGLLDTLSYINWLVFITVVESFYSIVWTNSLYKADYV